MSDFQPLACLNNMNEMVHRVPLVRERAHSATTTSASQQQQDDDCDPIDAFTSKEEQEEEIIRLRQELGQKDEDILAAVEMGQNLLLKIESLNQELRDQATKKDEEIWQLKNDLHNLTNEQKQLSMNVRTLKAELNTCRADSCSANERMEEFQLKVISDADSRIKLFEEQTIPLKNRVDELEDMLARTLTESENQIKTSENESITQLAVQREQSERRIADWKSITQTIATDSFFVVSRDIEVQTEEIFENIHCNTTSSSSVPSSSSTSSSSFASSDVNTTNKLKNSSSSFVTPEISVVTCLAPNIKMQHSPSSAVSVDRLSSPSLRRKRANTAPLKAFVSIASDPVFVGLTSRVEQLRLARRPPLSSSSEKDSNTKSNTATFSFNEEDDFVDEKKKVIFSPVCDEEYEYDAAPLMTASDSLLGEELMQEVARLQEELALQRQQNEALTSSASNAAAAAPTEFALTNAPKTAEEMSLVKSEVEKLKKELKEQDNLRLMLQQNTRELMDMQARTAAMSAPSGIQTRLRRFLTKRIDPTTTSTSSTTEKKK